MAAASNTLVREVALGYDHHLGFVKGMEDHFTRTSMWTCGSLNGTFSMFRDTEHAIGALNRWDPSGGQSLFLDVRFGLTHGPYQVPDQYRNPSIKNEGRQTLMGMSNIIDEGVGNLTNIILWQQSSTYE